MNKKIDTQKMVNDLDERFDINMAMAKEQRGMMAMATSPEEHEAHRRTALDFSGRAMACKMLANRYRHGFSLLAWDIWTKTIDQSQQQREYLHLINYTIISCEDNETIKHLSDQFSITDGTITELDMIATWVHDGRWREEGR